MKNTIALVLFVLTTYSVVGQQEAMFTHYMYNTQAVNPAYAGSRDALTLTGLHRSMWIGFDGAPETQTFTMHTPLFSSNFGAGLSLYNDKIGPITTTAISADLSYRVKVSKTGKLAFGIKPLLNMRTADLSQLKLTDETDDLLSNTSKNLRGLNLSAGLYYYTQKFYAGISSTSLLENSLDHENVENIIGETQMHFYGIIGGAIKLSPSVIFKPTSFVKVTEQAPIEGDFTASFLFNNKFWAGAMFRTGDALGALVGVYLTPQLSIGYSFDWSYANQTFEYNYGSHEIMIRYDFIYHNKKQIISPRYF